MGSLLTLAIHETRTASIAYAAAAAISAAVALGYGLANPQQFEARPAPAMTMPVEEAKPLPLLPAEPVDESGAPPLVASHEPNFTVQASEVVQHPARRGITATVKTPPRTDWYGAKIH